MSDDRSIGGGFKWFVGVVVALLAAGSGIVALLTYFNPSDGKGDTSDSAQTQSVDRIRVEGENFSQSSGGVQVLSDGGVRFLGYLTDGAWATYASGGLGSGVVNAIVVRVASATDGGTILLRAKGPNGAQLGLCDVPGTGGWTTWETVQCDVQGSVPTGTSQIYAQFSGTGNPYLLNLDWIEIS